MALLCVSFLYERKFAFGVKGGDGIVELRRSGANRDGIPMLQFTGRIIAHDANVTYNPILCLFDDYLEDNKTRIYRGMINSFSTIRMEVPDH